MIVSPININNFYDYLHKLYLLYPLHLSVFMRKYLSFQDEVRNWCASSRLSLCPSKCKQPTEYLVEDPEAPGYAKTERKMEGSCVAK